MMSPVKDIVQNSIAGMLENCPIETQFLSKITTDLTMDHVTATDHTLGATQPFSMTFQFGLPASLRSKGSISIFFALLD